jgi:hypothetical protein
LFGKNALAMINISTSRKFVTAKSPPGGDNHHLRSYEFSLIVAALDLRLGHISAETMGLMTLVGVVTIFASTYMVLYSIQLYRFLSKPLKIFEWSHPFRKLNIDCGWHPARRGSNAYPSPRTNLVAGDRLIVIGNTETVERLKQHEPLRLRQ